MNDTPAVAFFDVDGTLISHDPEINAAKNVALGQVSPAVSRAFAAMRKRGNLAFICTGRPYCLVNRGLLDLAPTGLITSAGACLFIEGRCVYERMIDEALLESTVAWLVDERIEVLFEGSACTAALMPNGGVFDDIPGAISVRTMDELRAKTDMRFCKFSYRGEMIGRMADMPEPLRSRYSFYDLGVGAGEAGLSGIDKAYGVRRALKFLGHGVGNTYAFGDSENDLPMLRAVETSVAMGNAMDAVKAEADYVTGSVADDGVAAALGHFGLA